MNINNFENLKEFVIKTFNYLNGKVNTTINASLNIINSDEIFCAKTIVNRVYFNLNSLDLNNEYYSKEMIIETITHELCHVDQYVNPEYLQYDLYRLQLETDVEYKTLLILNDKDVQNYIYNALGFKINARKILFILNSKFKNYKSQYKYKTLESAYYLFLYGISYGTINNESFNLLNSINNINLLLNNTIYTLKIDGKYINDFIYFAEAIDYYAQVSSKVLNCNTKFEYNNDKLYIKINYEIDNIVPFNNKNNMCNSTFYYEYIYKDRRDELYKNVKNPFISTKGGC